MSSVRAHACAVLKGVIGECVWQGDGSQQCDTTSFNHWGEKCVFCSWDAHAFRATAHKNSLSLALPANTQAPSAQ